VRVLVGCIRQYCPPPLAGIYASTRGLGAQVSIVVSLKLFSTTSTIREKQENGRIVRHCLFFWKTTIVVVHCGR